MKRIRIMTAGAITLWVVASEAHAIPLPDSGSCNSGSPCLDINNSGSGYAIRALGGLSVSESLYADTNGPRAIHGVAWTSGIGVYGKGNSSTGVHGESNSGDGVHGTSTNKDGVSGESNHAGYAGVAGFNWIAGGTGVYGVVSPSGSGAAIYGDASNSSTAWAGYFAGRVRATQFVTASDLRLKKEIQDLPYGHRAVSTLRPVAYKWKDGDPSQHRQLGLIAQEVQRTIPEAVETDSKSGLLSVNYQALVPVLIKGLQEQQKIIARQEARLAALEKARSPALSSLLGASSSPGLMLALLLPFGVVSAWRRLKRAHRSAPGT